ncbi:hypothetical protein DAPPUDRAFT_239936 [Daphnia pulex]|uniref:Uncharacterized protein n=1 Tax=Daphnia pulex TaxID=6669 RepID=E9GAG7_DAPPU|nr:hypothetical protein DAPPUDRAFT_239936 [Daphnia pulex]|eukprot:EFX83238.1 hypothetical protein DAPPUDRAFT_239936 [Daphnia pulex]
MLEFKIIVASTLLLCFCVRNSELSPLPQSWSDVSSAGNMDDQTAFLIENGVTQEEIEEFQRQSGTFPLTVESQDMDESQSRSFGNILPTLRSSKGIAAAAIGIGAAAKFLILLNSAVVTKARLLMMYRSAGSCDETIRRFAKLCMSNFDFKTPRSLKTHVKLQTSEV